MNANSPPPCRSTTTAIRYDRYGNTETLDESTPDGDRRTYTPVAANPTTYIVDRPSKREILIPGPGPGGWVTQTRTLYGYDNQPLTAAPGTHGDLTEQSAVTDLTTGASATTTHIYDAVGNITSTIDPVRIETKTVYDTDRSLFPQETCKVALCPATRFTTTWDEVHGLIITTTDPNRQTTTTHYDAFGRPDHIQRPDGSTTDTWYLSTGQVTGPEDQRQRIRTETSDNSPGDHVHWDEQLIDGLGRIYQTRGEGITTDSRDTLVTDTRYLDATAAPAAVSTTHRAADAQHWTLIEYDPLRRPTDTIHPGGTASTSINYQIGYAESTDERGNVTTTHYDAFGRISSVDEYVRTCFTCQPTTHTTSYTYDATDQLTGITDAQTNVTTIIRDSVGRQVSFEDPDRGTTTTVYRADGSIDSEIRPDGTTTWIYDQIGRADTATVTGATGIMRTTWHYDFDPITGQQQGHSIGLPTQINYTTRAPGDAAVTGSNRIWYDTMGRPENISQCADNVCYAMGYHYDQAGRLASLDYPNPAPETVTYDYDPAGRLTTVGSYLTGVLYDATGAVTDQTYGNGHSEHFSYDPDRLWYDTHTYTSPAGVDLYTATYTHDDTGNITTIDETPTMPSPLNRVHKTYDYDELNRLNYQSRSDRPTPVAETYDYDELGRITRSPSAGTYNYDDPAHIHAVTSTTAGHQRTYDPAGHLTRLTDPTGRDLTITWTPTGMPQTITDPTGTTNNAYAADGHRIKQTRTGANPITIYYLNQYLEHDTTGLTKSYYAGDRLIARRDPTGAITYLLRDHLNSTRIVTDQAGNITAQYDYQPYGKPEPNTPNATETPQQWGGQRHDPDSQLTYMNARFYDPELGQFTTPDTIIPNVYRPQSLNPYAYVEGNPINFTDPSGHMPIDVERKKEQQGGPSGARFFGVCGGFTGCETGVNECYDIGCINDVVLSAHADDVVYTGDLTTDGVLDFGSVSDTSVAGFTGNPSEWAQWPGDTSLSAPPLVDASDGSSTSTSTAGEFLAGSVTVEEGRVEAVETPHFGWAPVDKTGVVRFVSREQEIDFRCGGDQACVMARSVDWAGVNHLLTEVGIAVGGQTLGLASLGGGGAILGLGAVEGGTFEILDGVRRAKAASVAGQTVIEAEILGTGGATRQIPLSALRSPFKSEISTAGAGLDRWMNTLRQTLTGSKPPAILVQPGARGVAIESVVVN